MKKILSVIVCVGLISLVTGCSEKKDSDKSDSTETTLMAVEEPTTSDSIEESSSTTVTPTPIPTVTPTPTPVPTPTPEPTEATTTAAPTTKETTKETTKPTTKATTKAATKAETKATEAPKETSETSVEIKVEGKKVTKAPAAVADPPAPTESLKETSEELDYVVNTNTGKFHKPGCSSVAKMKEKNRADRHCTREKLINEGYQPCGNCHP